MVVYTLADEAAGVICREYILPRGVHAEIVGRTITDGNVASLYRGATLIVIDRSPRRD